MTTTLVAWLHCHRRGFLLDTATKLERTPEQHSLKMPKQSGVNLVSISADCAVFTGYAVS